MSTSFTTGPHPPKKMRYSNKLQLCFICQTSSSEKVSNASEKGKNTLSEAITIRQDEVYLRVRDEFESFDNVSIVDIKYHKSCYRSYTSKNNLAKFKNVTPMSNSGNAERDNSSRTEQNIITRSSFSKIDLNVCIFCKLKSYRQDRRLCKIESADRMANILEAAKQKMDTEMEHRVLREDFQSTALYHTSCIANYLLNWKKRKNETENDTENTTYDKAFSLLLNEIHDDLMVRKRAFLMTDILSKFSDFLPTDKSAQYKTWKLQRRLQKHYGDSIVIQTQFGQGKSSMVFSSSISVADAIKAADKLNSEIQLSDLEFQNRTTTMTNDQILHAASSILRQSIEEVDITTDCYPCPSQASLSNSLNRIPSSLSNFLLWLLDDNCFKDANTQPPNDKLRKCLAFAECIVSINKNAFTPFHLSLALQLHHEFGSKNLIESLNAHGFCSSYSEVRRYLTSLGNHELERMKKGSFVPNGIVSVSSGGSIIQEGADNVDLNTETIDGKNTFHSMARAVFQLQPFPAEQSLDLITIKRGPERSLPLDDQSLSMSSCLPFIKPKEKHLPHRIEQPYNKMISMLSSDDHVIDKVWVLLRLMNKPIFGFLNDFQQEQQCIPFWTGFNKKISISDPRCTVVAYPPIIDAKPSDMATVFTAMKQCMDVAKSAGQTFSIQTFDQQLYSIAQQVKWAHLDIFQNHVLRLGGFHALSCYIAAIGKLWASGGLRDLLVDSGVYASGTVDQMLLGKQFNRSVRGLTVAYEALMYFLFDSFFKWCKANDQFVQIKDEIWEALIHCHASFKEKGESQIDIDLLESLCKSNILPLFENFREWGRKSSPTFLYWDMFLQAVEVMLQNIRADRDGLWALHLRSAIHMLPYFFVTNRVNYSRWMPVYLVDMLNLHPDIQKSFEAGEFTIRQRAGSFNGIASDMATEKTIIKDSKGCSGIVGMTMKKSAVLRWTLTRHVLAQFSLTMRVRSENNLGKDFEHEENRPTALKRDEQHVTNIIDYVRESMTDPFNVEDHPKELINISTGVHASQDIQNSLLSATETGQRMAKQFIEGSFSNSETRNFYHPISKSPLKTFEDMAEKSKLKCRSGEILKVHINPELVFRRALVLTNIREDVTLEKVLSYPVGPIPTALFHDDGSMRKSCKADIIHVLEGDVCPAFVLPEFDSSNVVLIRDGMALIQSLQIKTGDTFGDLGHAYIKQQLSCFDAVGTVVDVFDRYDIEHSIKSFERSRRSKSGVSKKIYQVIEGRSIPDWKKFLSSNDNKQALIRFLGEFILGQIQRNPLINGKQLFLAGLFPNPECVKMISERFVEECPDLFSSQEEADSRMIVHVMHSDKNFGRKNTKGRIIIKSPDTDVLVLCVHFFPQMQNTDELWFQTGTISNVKDNRRFIPVHHLCQSMSPITCKILPAAHALTGSDTTCAFFGIGKKSVLKILKETPNKYKSLSALASSDVEAAMTASRNFVSRLYDPKERFKEHHSSLNKLRFIFATSKESSLVRLPPCEASFKQHILRVMLQVNIWFKSCEAKPSIGSPFDHGWCKSKSGLTPVFFQGQMSSDFLQDLVCDCKGKSPCSKNCMCRQQNLSCTELCTCCSNDFCRNELTYRTDIAEHDDSDDDEI